MHTPFTKTVNLYLSFNFQVTKFSERGVRQNIILITGGGVSQKIMLIMGGRGGVSKKIILDYRGEGGVQITPKLDYVIYEWSLVIVLIYLKVRPNLKVLQ